MANRCHHRRTRNRARRPASASTASRPPSWPAIEIPHYCWHPGLSVVGSCRMCLVEIGTRNPETGKITMQPKLVPACKTPVTDNMVIVTNSEKVARAGRWSRKGCCCGIRSTARSATRRASATCRTITSSYGQDERRADIRPFTSRRRDMGDVTLFVDRCVMCSRCVRFTPRDQRHQRTDGHRPRQPRGDRRRCPAFRWTTSSRATWSISARSGRWATRTFFYQQRVWFMRQHRRRLHRLLDRLLDRSRRTRTDLPDQAARQSARQQVVDLQRRPLRLSARPQRPPADERRGAAKANELTVLEWSQVDWPRSTSGFAQAGRLAAVLSPHLTVEEAYLLAKFVAADRSRRRCSCWGPCRSWARTSVPERLHDPRREVSQPPRRRGDRQPLHGPRRDVRRAAGRRRGRARSAAFGSPADTSTIGSTRPRPSGFDRLDVLGRARPVPLAAFRAGDVRAARRRVRRARRLVRQPGRPAAKRSPGPSARPPACGSKPASTGVAGDAQACSMPGACWRRSPRDPLFLRRRRAGRPAGGRSESQCGGGSGHGEVTALQSYSVRVREREPWRLTLFESFDLTPLVPILILPLLKIALLIVALMTAAAYLVLLGALDRRLGAGPAGAEPGGHSADEDPAVRPGPAAGRRREVHLQGRSSRPRHVDKVLFIAGADVDLRRGAWPSSP